MEKNLLTEMGFSRVTSVISIFPTALQKYFLLLSFLLSPFISGQVTIFSENMGSPPAITAISANNFQNGVPITFSGTGDVRTTLPSTAYSGSSAGGNIFITNTSGIYFEIANIDTSLYTNLALTFGENKSAVSTVDLLTVEVSSDGILYTPLAYTRSDGAIWALISPGGSIPTAANLRIRFKNPNTTHSFRIDDVVLKGNLNAISSKGNSGITKNWSDGTAWVGGLAPSSNQNAVIAGTDVILVDNTTVGTRNSGTTTTVNASATLVTNVQYINNGVTNIKGTFQLDAGGYTNSGNNFVYGSASTLIFNNTSSYGVNSTDQYWPTTSSPYNVTILQGGITLNGGADRTIAGTFQTAAPVILSSAALTLNGIAKINNGGSFANAPIYGSASTLLYNTGTTFGRGNEWTSSTSGAGYPTNVQVSNPGTITTLNMGSSSAQNSGNLLIDLNTVLNSTSGNLTILKDITNNGSLNLGGDITLAGNTASNFTVGSAAIQNNNGKAVFFTSTIGNQTITKIGGGNVFFDYLVINKPSGNLILSSSPATSIIINTATISAGVLQLLNAGGLDLNGQSLTLNNDNGDISVSAPGRSITSGSGTGILVITGNKYISGTGTLNIGVNVTTVLTKGLDFGLNKTTVNGILQINGGGYVNNNAPNYGNASTLIYNGVSNYGVGNEWTGNATTTGQGTPQNVTLTNSSVNMPNTARSLAGNLSIGTASTFNLNGTLGADLNIGGNWNNLGVFSPNSRAVIFRGSTLQTITGSTIFDYLTVNNGAGITVANDVSINKILDFTNGKLTLGANNLTIGITGTITNYSTSKYIVSNGLGQLKQTVGSATVPFPVGPSSTNYNPISVTNSGTSDIYGFRVATGVSGSLDPTYVVKDSWFVSEAVAGGGSIRVVPQWNSPIDEGTNFTASNNYIDLFSPSLTFLPATVTASAATLKNLSDNFTSTYTGAEYFSVSTHTPQKINLKQSATQINSNATYTFANQTSGTISSTVTFTVQNLGQIDLTLGTLSISGGNPSEFAITQPSSSTIIGGNTTTFTVNFSPTTAGAKIAQLSLSSNDATQTPYIVNLAGTSTTSTVSDIVVTSGYLYPQNIVYQNYQATDITGGANDIEIAKLTIRDGGATADTDNLGTILTDLSFAVSNSSNIRRIALYEGTTEIAEKAGAASIIFSGLGLVAADGGTKDFSVRVSFNSAVTDNQNVGLQISAATIASASGSTFAATNAGGASTLLTANNNKIIVTADRLAFTTQPVNANINVNMPSFTISAVDVNTNLDVDAFNSVALTTSGTGITSFTPYTLSAGKISITNVQFGAPQTGITLTATTTGLSFSNSITSTTFNIAGNYYRSNVVSGIWSSPGSWEYSSNNVAWGPAVSFPTSSNATSIIIRNAQKITIANTGVSMTNTTVQSGGTLEITASTFAVNGVLNGIELTIENGGIFLVNAATMSAFSGNAYGVIKSGGKLVAGPSLGSGVGFATYFLGTSTSGLFYFEDKGICEWSSTLALGSGSTSQFFSLVNNTDMPIFRISTAMVNFGGTSYNLFNAVLEANANFSLSNSGSKTFTGGIRGTATVTQNTGSGNLILGDGINIPQIGGSVTLNVLTAGLQLPNGANVPLGATPLVMSALENNSINRQGGNLNIDGILDITNLRISNVNPGSIIVNGTLKTANTGGLLGLSSAIPSGTLILNTGSTIEYNATLAQQISSAPSYYNITFSGAGTKTTQGPITIDTNGLVKISGTTTVDATSNLASTTSNNTAFNMDGGRLILRTGGTQPNMIGAYNLTGGVVEFAGTSITRIRAATPQYINIDVSGTNVYAGTSVNSGLTFKAGGKFTVKDNATFKVTNTAGFSGGTNTSIKSTNSPSIILEALSTIEYNGDLQIISNLTPTSPSDASYQNLRISGTGVKTASGTTKVKNTTYVDASELLIAETALDTDVPNIFYSAKGLQIVSPAKFHLGNNANLMQDDIGFFNSGNILLDRKAILPNNGYNYWCAPVTGQALLSDTFSPGTPNNLIFRYNEPTDTFLPTGDVNFVVGKGYAVRGGTADDGVNPHNFNFSGLPNNGNLSTPTLSFKDSSHGYNLIGNPYPSNLDFNKFFNGNSALMYSTAYFWTNNTYTPNQQGSNYGGANYAILNGTGGNPAAFQGGTASPAPTASIKPGQGFIIQMKSSASLSFDNAMRIPGGSHFFNNKSSSAIDRFHLTLTTPSNINNILLIGYVEGATNNFEQDFDAELLIEGSDSFYSKLGTSKLAIQGREYPLVNNDVIPLGVVYYESGLHKISLSSKEGVFNKEQNVYLKDRYTGTIINLSEKDYSFQATKGLSENRFEILYKPESPLATGEVMRQNLAVYKFVNDFIIKSKQKIKQIELFDTSGKLIFNRKPDDFETKISESILNRGVFILKIKLINDEMETIKIRN